MVSSSCINSKLRLQCWLNQLSFRNMSYVEVATPETLISETGFSIVRKAHGDELLRMVGALSTKLEGEVSRKSVEIRHLDDTNNRSPAISLLNRVESGPRYFGNLPILTCTRVIKSEVPSLSTEREVTFSRAKIFRNNIDEHFVELVPNSSDRRWLREYKRYHGGSRGRTR